jgi:hypothetical protein
MINLTKYALDDLLPVLESFKPALKSIDVRTVAVCTSPEDDWQNLISSVFISDKTVDEIKAEHEQLPYVRNKEDTFAIFYTALRFDYKFFDEISHGEFHVWTPHGNNTVKARAFDPLALKVSSIVEWINDSRFIFLKARAQGDTESRKNLWNVVYQQNTFANSCGFSNIQELIKHCLKLESYDYNIQKDLEVSITPLAKIGNTQFSGKQVRVNIQNPHKLNNLQLNFNLHPKQTWIKPHKIDAKTAHVDVKIRELSPLTTLNLALIHCDSGLTLDRTYETVPLESVADPFVKTLDTFCSLKKIEKMLFEPQKYGKNPQKIFENAVTWLLSLAGYETTNIGIIITKLNNKQEKFDELHLKNGYHVGSTDIIAYEDNKRLFLIDCDINTVDPKKVKKLAELKKHFREKLKGYEKLPIVPILFTPLDFRETSPSPDVMVADKSVIKKMFEAVVKGNRKEARSHIQYSGI